MIGTARIFAVMFCIAVGRQYHNLFEGHSNHPIVYQDMWKWRFGFRWTKSELTIDLKSKLSLHTEITSFTEMSLLRT